jgi:hypothetical protein
VDVTAVFSADTTSTSADSTKLTADTVTISTPVTGTGNLVILPDRANLIKRSQELDSSTWGTSNLTVIANAAMAPDSTMTADRLNDGVSSFSHDIYQFISATNGLTYTCSVYAKAESLSWFQIYLENNIWANFDVTNGVVGKIGANVTSTSIVAVGNGWYRCSLTARFTTASTPYLYLLASDVAAGGSNTNYPGSNRTMLFWGMQVEPGNVTTAYIPTQATAVTVSQGGPSPSGIGRNGWNGSGALDGSLAIEIMGRATFSSQSLGNLASSAQLGQSFIATTDQLNSITLTMSATGSPTDGVCLQVYNETLPATVRGQPSDTITVRTSTITNYKFTFNPPISLVPGNSYSFSIARTGALDASNYYQTRVDSAAVYTGGTLLRLATGTWTTVNNDVTGFLAFVGGSRLTGVGVVASASVTGTGALTTSTSVLAASGISGSSNAPGSSPIPDIVIPGPGSDFIFGGINYGAGAEGQAFIATGTAVTKISASICKYGAPSDSLRCRISTTDANHLPVALLGTTTISSSVVPPNTSAMVDFTFATPVAVNTGQLYHIAIDRTGAPDDENLYAISLTDDRVYQPGLYSVDQPGGGENWYTDPRCNLMVTISQVAGAVVPPLQVASSTLAGTGFAGSAVTPGTGALVAAQAQVTGVGTASSVGGGVIPTAGLICHWKLSDGSGTDLSGSNNHGVFVGGVTPSSDGPMGNAAVFDGTTGYVGLGGTLPLNLDYFSHSVWVKTTQTVSGNIVGFANGWASGTSDHTLLLQDGGLPAFYVYAGAINILNGIKPINDGQWHHIVGTLGPVGAPGGGGQKIYIDGVLHIADVNVTNGAYSYYDQPNVFLGGIVGAYGTNFVKGSFADLLIYNRPLTAAEVAAIYAANSVAAPPVTGTGVLTSSGPVLAASGTSGSVGSAVLADAASGIVASGASISFATGSLVAGLASLAGTGLVASAGTGALASPASAAAGSGVSRSVATSAALQASVSVLAGAEGVSDVTGTGEARSQSSSLSGAGVTVSTGTGALASNGCALAGGGLSQSRGPSQLTAQAAAIVGTGTQLVQGSGALACGASSIAGLGSPLWVGSGAVAAAAASLTGSGVSHWLGVAALAASASDLSGAGVSSSTATAALAASRSSVFGAEGVVVISGTGSLVAQSHTVAGAGLGGSSGAGVLAAPAHVLDGEAVSQSRGLAALQGSAAAASAEGVSASLGAGDLTSTATLAGTGSVQHHGSGVLPADIAKLDGSAIAQSVGRGDLVSTNAAADGAGESSVSGVAVLVSRPAQLAGFANLTASGAGDLVAADHGLDAVGIVEATGFGSLPAHRAELDGSGWSEGTGTGMLVSRRALMLAFGEVESRIEGQGDLTSRSALLRGSGQGLSFGQGVLAARSSSLVSIGGVSIGSGDLRASSSTITGSGGVDVFGDWVPVALPPSYPGTAPWSGATATWKGATATWINPGTGQWRNPGTVTPPWPRRAA